MQVQLGRRLLGEGEPAEVVLERPVGVDAGLDAQLGGAVGHGLADAAHEVLARVFVGVGRALGLAEAAERAADDAHVGDVEVAVDDERDLLPGELRAQLIGRLAHVLDRLGARLGEHGSELLRAQRPPLAALLDRVRDELLANRGGRVGAAGPAPRDEAPVAALDRVEHRGGDPLAVDVAGVHAQPLGERVALALQPAAHLVRRGERVLGRDVVAVGAEAAEVACAGVDQLDPPVGEVGWDLDRHVGHEPACLGDQAAHVLDAHGRGPRRQRLAGALLGDPGAPVSPGGGIGDLRGLAAVVALVRDEVLQDQLLDVPVARVHVGERFQRGDALVLALADANEDAAGERDLQLAGRFDHLQAPCRVLAGRPGVHGAHEALGDRLEHEALRGAHLAQARKLLAREHAEVGVRQQPALERALASPGDIRGEVGVPVGAQPLAHLGVDLGALAGQDEQLLHPPARSAVEHREHLIGRIQVRLVGGEGAVLAVAATGARQRQREVAAERDPAAHSWIL